MVYNRIADIDNYDLVVCDLLGLDSVVTNKERANVILLGGMMYDVKEKYDLLSKKTKKCSMPMCSNQAVEYWVEDDDGTAIFLNTDMCDHCVEMMLGRG